MKRVIFSLFAVFALVMASTTVSSAQGLYLKGGLTYGKAVSDFKDFEVKSYAGWQIGAGFQTEPVFGFSIQPEILYTIRGAQIGDFGDVRMSNIEIPVNVQWGIDLVVLKPFIFAAPFVGYNIKNAMGKQVETLKDVLDETKKFEYGIGLGAGVELLRRIQITAKYDWNFGNINSWSDYVSNVKNIDRATGGMVLSVGLRF